jgi:hypothetical protein
MADPMRGAEMTEYIIKEVGRHQWLVFADRKSIALCTDENTALRLMADHSAAKQADRHVPEVFERNR